MNSSIETKVDVKVDANVTEILKIYWPIMTLPLVILAFIGIGGYFIASTLSNEIHMIILLYVYILSGLLLYGGATRLFYNDVKKAISNPALSTNQ